MKNLTQGVFWQRIALSLVVISIIFRFSNLDAKMYWYDEAYTSLRLAGYTTAEMVADLSAKSILKPQDILKYQQLNGDRHLPDTIKGLALEEAQLPPLYFSLVRIWAQFWGSSIAAVRSLSALISLFSFPLIYWLMQELCYFLPVAKKNTASWIGVALLATSPYQLIYAQESRPYGLWVATILFSTTCLMRATRLGTVNSWLLYSLGLMLGLYTQLLTFLLIITHSVFVALKTGLRWGKLSKSYLLATSLSLVTFIPWAITLYLNIVPAAQAISTRLDNNPSSLVSRFLRFSSNLAGSVTRQFVDFNLGHNSPRSQLLAFSLVMLSIIALVIYSLSVVFRELGDQGKLILCLALVPWLMVILIDILTQNNRASVSRYLMPCWLSLQIAVAYLFAHKLNSIHPGIQANSFKFIPTKFAWFWQLSLSLILGLGLLSYGTMINTVVWWSHRLNYNNPQIAAVVNQSDRPLILSKIDMNIVTLSYRLTEKVAIKPVETRFPTITSEFTDVFLYMPEELMTGFQADPNYQVQAFTNMRIVEPFSPSLWKVSKR
jgi:uncharacterized membrane protein